jgi:hypothetical protein
MTEKTHILGTEGGTPHEIVDANTLVVPTQVTAAISAAVASGARSAVYTAGTPGDWDTAPPTPIGAAIARLAAQVTKLGASVPPTPPTKP